VSDRKQYPSTLKGISQWAKDNSPELDWLLRRHPVSTRRILNDVTGLNVERFSRVSHTTYLFIDELEKLKESGELQKRVSDLL
jgi:hypothetical protein